MPDASEVTSDHIFDPMSAGERWAAALVAVARYAPNLPLLVISDYGRVEDALRLGGMPIVARIGPSADENAWHHVLHQLIDGYWSNGAREHCPAMSGTGAVISTTSGVLRLRADLYFEPDGCAMVEAAGGKRIALTAQEYRVLAVLARTPRRFHGTEEFADALSGTARRRMATMEGTGEDSDAYLMAHRVEQAICALRRKLGESARVRANRSTGSKNSRRFVAAVLITGVAMLGVLVLASRESAEAEPSTYVQVGSTPAILAGGKMAQVPAGLSAIRRMKTDGSPIARSDVVRYVESSTIPMTLGAPSPLAVTRAELLPSTAISAILSGESTGFPGDKLLWFVEVRGPVTFPASPKVGSVTSQYAYLIFDPDSGNLLMSGGLSK